MRSEISVSTGLTICEPLSRKTLYPLSAGGLCDAVTTTPAAASSPVIDHASTGVGCTPGWSIERIPIAASTRAVSRANTSLLRRASLAMTTPRTAAFSIRPAASSSSSQRPRPAAAWRTTSRFIRIEPAPTAARSPAVPNCNRPSNRAARSSRADWSPAPADSISDESSVRRSSSGSAASHFRAVSRTSASCITHEAYATRRADAARRG